MKNSSQKLTLEKINGTSINLLYVSLISPYLQTFLFLLKTQNTTTLQQVTSGKTLILVLKKMLELSRKFMKIIEFQSWMNSRKQTSKKWDLEGEKLLENFPQSN